MEENDENKNEPKPVTQTEHWINSLDKQSDENAYWTAMQKEWIRDLKINPRYKIFYDRFHPASIDSFISHYACYKHLWLRYGPFHKNQLEEKATGYKEEAYDCLWEIQQKKLFNLQCRWRAEQIELPGVEISFDFKDWEHRIHECPFLPPVTAEEVELYKQYLLGTDYSKIGWLQGWQDYDEYKEEYISGGDSISMPEWYMFYDMRKGTGSLMLLPDVRGEKEELYMELCRKKRRADWEQEQQQHPEKYPAPDPRPPLNYYSNPGLIVEFIRMFDDKKTLEGYHAYTESNKQVFEDDEEVDEIFRKIMEVKEYVPIAAHFNWREALKSAYYNYNQRMIAEALPAAFDEYDFRTNMKIAHHAESESWFKEHAKEVRKMIIEGRLLNGEPGDLNF